jgi:membrane protein required for colicin V production
MIIDLIVVVILLISGVIAFLRGFIREILTILGVVGGVVAAYAVGPHIVPYFNQWLGVEDGAEPERLFGVVGYDILAQVLAYGSVFLIVVIVLSVVSHVLSGLARSIGLGAIDRTLGFVFGIARGLILLGLLYLPVYLFVDQETKAEWFKDSRSHVYIEQTSGFMAQYLPAETKSDVEKGIKQLQDANTTREKINTIDLLKQNNLKPGQPVPADDEAAPAGGQGYDEQERQQMDELINKQAQ